MSAAQRNVTRQAFLLGLCLSIAAACAGGSVTGVGRDLPDVAITDPPHLYRSQQSGVTDDVRIVIRDAAAWQAFWRDLVQGAADVPAQPPAVDFTAHVVIVAALGARERAGYHIAVGGYQRTAGHTRVTILKSAPPADCHSSPVITTPIAITAVATGVSVTFRELEEGTSCPD